MSISASQCNQLLSMKPSEWTLENRCNQEIIFFKGMKNTDSKNSTTENHTQHLPVLCVGTHSSFTEVLGRSEFYVKMELGIREFLDTLLLSVYIKSHLILPALISQMRTLEAEVVIHPNSHNKRCKPRFNCFNVCKAY